MITMIGQKVLGVQNLQAPKTYTSYQFEVIHTTKEATDLKRKAEALPPKFCMMAKMKFKPDRGLGKFSQGRKDPIKAIRVPHKTSLGFKPSLKHQAKWSRKKKWAGLKASKRFISISKLAASPLRTYITVPNEPQTLVSPSILPTIST